MSKVQIIRDEDNEPAYAVIPWDDYKNLTESRTEEAMLIERALAAQNDEKFPSPVARRLIAGEVPLKVFREWRELSQRQLSEASGVASQYISQIERGTRNVGREVASKLARALGVSVRALTDEDEDEVAKFAIGQKYRANKHPARIAEVMQIDPESNGWKAWVDVRDSGKLLKSDWANFAEFSMHWTKV